ncbi:MAG: hypothetical protein JST89_00665 [Cyanobacteria bacterium SZAS-4]|nr:hypothetical protein [Cyanobacteria bacterium SZAS-4]
MFVEPQDNNLMVEKQTGTANEKEFSRPDMLKLVQKKGTTADTVGSLQVYGTAGETITLPFQIASEEEVQEFRLNTFDSAANNSEILVDLFVAKTWQTAGVGIYQSKPMLVEELLLKDDRISLKDSYRKSANSWRDVFKPISLYVAPKLPDHNDVRTTLLPNQSKSFVARIKIADNAKPVTHTTILTGTTNGKNVLQVSIRIDVKSMQLLDPPQDFFIWYKGRLDRHCPQHYVSEELLELQMLDIFEHGFNGISIGETDTELAQKAIDIAERIGFEKIVLMPPFPELIKLKFRKAQPIVYLSDELDMHVEFAEKEKPEALIAYHQLNFTRAKTVNGAVTMASLLNHTFVKRFQNAEDIGHAPEITSLYLNRNKEYLQFIEQLKQSVTSKLFYYWQCFMEKPSLNRVLAGAYLWKSGAAGISPYCYQHMPVYPNSPFNDFDEWEPDFHESGIDRPFKDHMTTYPARNGVIPTLQWEALRDGITDFKYWFTLHHWIEKGLTSQKEEAIALAEAAQRRSDAVLSRIDLIKIAINSETEQEPYRDIAPHEYEEFRNQLRDDIQALTAVLG